MLRARSLGTAASEFFALTDSRKCQGHPVGVALAFSDSFASAKRRGMDLAFSGRPERCECSVRAGMDDRRTPASYLAPGAVRQPGEPCILLPGLVPSSAKGVSIGLRRQVTRRVECDLPQSRAVSEGVFRVERRKARGLCPTR
jgi:hypothetical protein